MSVCLFYIHRFSTSFYGPYVARNKPDLIWFDFDMLIRISDPFISVDWALQLKQNVCFYGRELFLSSSICGIHNGIHISRMPPPLKTNRASDIGNVVQWWHQDSRPRRDGAKFPKKAPLPTSLSPARSPFPCSGGPPALTTLLHSYIRSQ